MRFSKVATVCLFVIALLFSPLAAVLLSQTAWAASAAGSVTAATTAATAAGTATAGNYRDVIAAAQSAVANQMAFNGASAATVALMVGGKIVYAEGFGLRNRALSLPVTPDTQFNIGSVSKLFVTATLLTLVQSGQVVLDEPITTYLPEFTMPDARYRAITVRMLLNHTAGFPGTHFKNGFSSVKNRTYVQETIANLQKSYLKHDPGAISVYCNDGFTLVEAIIERVTGRSYPQVLQTRILSRLGLQHSSAYFQTGFFNLARSYADEGAQPLPLEYVNILGSGGLASTAEDLCRFARILFDHSVLNDAMLKEWTVTQAGPLTVPVGQPLFNPGLGWDFAPVQSYAAQGLTVLAKGGDTMQYHAQLNVLPDQEIALAAIFSGNAQPAMVVDAMLQALIKAANLGTAAAIEETGLISAGQTEPMPVAYARFAGYYGTSGAILQVEPDFARNGLAYGYLTPDGRQPGGLMTYQADGLFRAADGESWTCVSDDQGSYLLSLAADPAFGLVRYEKLQPIANPADSQAFQDKIWIPRNLSATDLFPRLLTTAAIDGLPGYIYVASPLEGSCMAAALRDHTSTRMPMRYARDQVELRIEPRQGSNWLQTGGYTLTDAAGLPLLQLQDSLTIGSDGANEAGRFSESATVRFSIPHSGRIVIFSPTLSLVYDSLATGNQPVQLAKGSYVLAIGQAGDRFKIRQARSFSMPAFLREWPVRLPDGLPAGLTDWLPAGFAAGFSSCRG